jgi:hypothetical protein
MGEGDPVLGRKILGTCLRKLAASRAIDALILYNEGVKLAVKESPIVTELFLLREIGVSILPCQTCVEHYGLSDQLAVDHVSNMDEILDTLADADKVITL